MGDEWVYSRYETRAALRDAYDNREINAIHFFRTYRILLIKESYKKACDKLAALKEWKIKPTLFEKKILGLCH